MFRLQAEREKRRLSQSQLARLADVHPSTLSRLESGKIYPYPAWRRRLGRTLGVSGDVLFEQVEPDEAGKA